jgi:hypothetical protein
VPPVFQGLEILRDGNRLSNSPRRARRRGGGWGSAGAPAEDGASGFSVAARLRQELRRGLAAANGLPLPPVARLGRRLGRDVWVFCSGGRGRRRIIPDEQDGGPRLRQWQATPTAVASHAYGSGKRCPAPRPRHRRAATEDRPLRSESAEKIVFHRFLRPSASFLGYLRFLCVNHLVFSISPPRFGARPRHSLR